MKSIKELNEYCRLNNKRIIVRKGKMVGLSPSSFLARGAD